MTHTADNTDRQETAMWKPMTYAQLIASTDNHKTRRHHQRGLDHLRSCWCAKTPAPSSSVGGTTTSGEEQAHG